MKKTLLFSILFFLGMSLFAQTDIEEEKEAIKKVINTAYLEWLQNEGDLEKIDSGIHPGFVLLGKGQGEAMWKLPINQWKDRVKERKAEGYYPRTGEDKISINFKHIDVTGTAAMVKLEFFVGDTLTYVDYISLYKFDGKWMMVNKIFYTFPK